MAKVAPGGNDACPLFGDSAVRADSAGSADSADLAGSAWDRKDPTSEGEETVKHFRVVLRVYLGSSGDPDGLPN